MNLSYTDAQRKQYNVSILGDYATGKKTLVNSLVGQSLLVQSKWRPCSSDVQVWHNNINYRVISCMHVEYFTHFTHQLEHPWIKDADAIVMVLDATRLFSAAEKECIISLFGGQGYDNVFFIVNKCHLIESKYKSYIEKALKENLFTCFTDIMGRFNENLYNERVFMVDANDAYCIRTGEPPTITIDKNAMVRDVSITDTGIPKFEDALNRYLKSRTRHFDRFGGR